MSLVVDPRVKDVLKDIASSGRTLVEHVDMTLEHVDDKSEEVTEEVWEGYVKVFDRPVMSMQERRAALTRERRMALLDALDSSMYIMEDDPPETDGISAV